MVAISTEGIFLYTALIPWFNQFVACGDANRICSLPCAVTIGMVSGDYGSPVSFSLRAWRVGSGTRQQPAPRALIRLKRPSNSPSSRVCSGFKWLPILNWPLSGRYLLWLTLLGGLLHQQYMRLVASATSAACWHAALTSSCDLACG